ncbi:hypothetical protein [Brevibacillus reuszeri]|uniref:hypothetical protein n=1 Tax=Brevibacillus TaxID=55080 RepID=UPI0013DF6B5D|nr:hypothetical protein [Brevibacillus reuszeri]GIO10125.1 hypothetical protein J31TS6_61530 [Brevibacillus reuszeri]
MLYIIGFVVAVVAAGYFFSGMLSQRARDKHAIKNYSDDAYAQQYIQHNYHHQNHGPF